jgi:flagellar assembly protein FliH
MPIPVKAFEYPRALESSSLPSMRPQEPEREPEASASDPGMTLITENDVAAAYEKGRQEGRLEAEQRFREQLTLASASERAKVSKIISEFQESSSEYYSKVEDQVVHLALGIAGKILHRESQVDPLLVAALVKLATENLKQGSKVQVYICSSEIDSWRRYFEQDGNGRVMIELLEDPSLSPGDCTVHSEVGIAALGISAQLKEIERGLFDLLAQRPKND